MAALHAISKGHLRMQLQDLAGQPVALYPGLKSLGIGLTGASMLSQAIYWTERTRDAGGWFYKSQEEWEQETGLSRSEQELARKKLVAIGVLHEKKKGVPCRLHFMVDSEELFALLSDPERVKAAQEACKSVCGNPATKNSGNLQAGMQERSKQACGKPASKAAGKAQAITENTTETTAEITPLALVSADAASKRRPKANGEAEQARQEACRAIWGSYAQAYVNRYGAAPVRNAKVNRQVVDLWKRLGAEAAAVAEYFVSINDSYLIRNCHDLGSLLTKAESYRTQWATGRQMNGRTARQIEDTQANLNAAQEAAARIRARENGGVRNDNPFLR